MWAMGTRRPGTRQDLGPGTSRGLAEESRDNTKVPGHLPFSLETSRDFFQRVPGHLVSYPGLAVALKSFVIFT